MNRAIAKLHIVRAIDDAEQRTIEGIASTPTPDRYDDVLMPEGAKFALPIALLWQHDHGKPIGSVTHAGADKRGIGFRARIAKVEEPGPLRDRLEEAWLSIQAGLVRGVSVGFRPLKFEPREGGKGLCYLSWEWIELSACVIPANVDASILAIRSYDDEQRRAMLPKARVVRLDDPLPGRTASRVRRPVTLDLRSLRK